MDFVRRKRRVETIEWSFEITEEMLTKLNDELEAISGGSFNRLTMEELEMVYNDNEFPKGILVGEEVIELPKYIEEFFDDIMEQNFIESSFTMKHKSYNTRYTEDSIEKIWNV